MIQEFVDRFMQARGALAARFKGEHPGSYQEIVKAVVDLVKGDAYGHMDPDRISVIDHGDYQGTLLFVIPAVGYQPDEYWYVKVGYGCCSGCDTLAGIRGYDDGPPSDGQVQDYMTLALHVVQGLKLMA